MLEMLLATPKLTLPHHCSQAPWDTGVWCWGLSAIPWTPRCTLGWPGSTPAAGFRGNGEAHPCQQTPAVPQSLVSSPPVTWCPPEYLQRCSAPDLGWLSDREAKYDPAVTLLHPPPSFAPAGYCLASHIPPIHPSIRRTSSPPPSGSQAAGLELATPFPPHLLSMDQVKSHNPIPSQGLRHSSCEMGQHFPPVSGAPRQSRTCL